MFIGVDKMRKALHIKHFSIFPINPCFFPMNLLFPIPYQRFINSFSLLCKRNFSCAGDGRNDAITSGETMLISLTRFSLHPGESSRTPLPDIRALSNNPSRNYLSLIKQLFCVLCKSQKIFFYHSSQAS